MEAKSRSKTATKQKIKTKSALGKSLKKVKSWKQLSQLNSSVEPWAEFQPSCSQRLPWIQWRNVWPGKCVPLRWQNRTPALAGSLLEESFKSLSAWTAEKPPKAKRIQAMLELVQQWEAGLGEAGLGKQLESAESGQQQTIALEGLSVAWMLPWLAEAMEAAAFDRLLGRLVSLSSHNWDVETQPVLANALGIELPFVLYYQFPDLLAVAECHNGLIQRLGQAMDPCLDGNGLPNATIAGEFAFLLASWTRVYQLGKFMKQPIFMDQTDDQYQWAARQYLRMLRSDGSLLLGTSARDRSDLEFAEALLSCNDDLEDWQVAGLTLPGSKRFAPASAADVKESRLPDAADETEWGKLAVLRSKWKAKSDKLIVDYSGRDVRLELENHRVWLQGDMQTTVRIDGSEVELDETWSEVCWHSDDDCVYLEIQNELADGVGILQRQFLLARYHRFCMITDSVLLTDAESKDPPAHSIDHHWSLPLADKVSFEAAKETHEGHLVAGKHQLSVLPLTLPEWRTEFSRGSLSTEQHQLLTHYSLPTGRLYQAVFIDLDHRRSREPLTWRPLIVGENLEPVTIDKAVGFRVQLDRMQYLLYRSLAPIVGRTLLGHNYYCDFYAGQFLPNGLCEDILMINGPEDDDA